MITSKLTRQAQTTIPPAVRQALGLREGDEIAYHIENGQVTLTRATASQGDDPFASFSEWDTEADRRAYAALNLSRQSN